MRTSSAVFALFASVAIAAPWAQESESTVTNTNYKTVTSCHGAATACPASQVPASPIVNGTTAAPTGSNGPVASATKTLYSTKVYTITSCAPTITNCPAHSTVVKTDVVSITTTVCPVTATPIITESVAYETKYSTKEVTITSCASTVTNCPAHSTVVKSTPVSVSLVPLSTITITTLIPTASVGKIVASPSIIANPSITAVPTVASVPTVTASSASEGETIYSTSVATITSCPAGVSSCPAHTSIIVATIVPTSVVVASPVASGSSVPVQEATVASSVTPASSPVGAPSVAPAPAGTATGTGVFNATAPQATGSPIAFTGAANSLTAHSLLLAGVAVFGAMLAL